MPSYDAIVIGAGVIGSSVAYHLARFGAGRVLVLERLQCSCALNSDHLCSLNFDQVERPARRGAGCG